jgi:Rieske Fe-S protein
METLMSLEDEIAKLTAATERQNALLEKVLANANGGAAAPAKTETKPAEPAKAETKPADPAGITLQDLLAKLTPWMNEEFAKDHPETVARKAAMKEVLTKLGETKVSAITDATKIAKLDKWFETKMKGVRLAPDAPAASTDGDEEEL